jgi:sulfur carrier protein ThiS
VKVRLRNPDREVQLDGGHRPVSAVLDELGVAVDTVLVIRAGELITRETRVGDEDELEIRPVISGGAR